MNKMPVKTQVKICTTFVWAGALISLLSQTFASWMLWVGIAVTAIAAVCRCTLIRCPHCGHRLVDNQSIQHGCPNCGGNLD